jgi:hypothetical protein
MENIEFGDYQKGMKQINADIPLELWTAAKQNLISFTEAIKFGIKFKLAEKDGGLTFEYPDNMLLRKVQNLVRIIQERNDEIDKLKGTENKKDAHEEFNDEINKILPDRAI